MISAHTPNDVRLQLLVTARLRKLEHVVDRHETEGDESYLQMEAQTAGLFVPGSVHDTVIVGI